MMGGGPVRRTLTVLLVYAAGAWLVLLLGDWLRRVLALPILFDSLLRWGVFLGAGVAALMAWHYPALATGDGPGEPDGPGPPDGGRGR